MIKLLTKSSLLFISFLFVSFSGIAQVTNDNCSTAQDLGSLPTPGACPGGNGNTVTVSGTLNGATSSNPYIYQAGCSGTATTMASPARDVWYKFVATGYKLNISLTGTVVNPNIAVWSGSCGSVSGLGCTIGSASGIASMTINSLAIGSSYFIQISGNSSGAAGNFSLTVDNDISCGNCLVASTITPSPLPVNGSYYNGQTVNFCFKVNQYNQTNTNWFHGVQITLGSGWNASSLTATSFPPACDGSAGHWGWFNSCTSSNGPVFGQGFYFDLNNDGDPGNSFGDNCSGAISGANWNFCFSVTTKANCSPGDNLSITINTTGDGESGSWTNSGCNSDPANIFNALSACATPTISSSPSCQNYASGYATASPSGMTPPYTFIWLQANDTIATHSNISGPDTLFNLFPGNYSVNIIDNNLLQNTSNFSIGGYPMNLFISGEDTVLCGSSVNLIANGAIDYSWNTNDTGASIQVTPASTTNFSVIGTSPAGCIDTAFYQVVVNIHYFEESGSVCQGDSLLWHNQYYKTQGVYYDSLTTTSGCDSIYRLTLQEIPVQTFNRDITRCTGDTYFAGGIYQSNPGTYYDTLQAISGCDSIIITNLTFSNTLTTNVYASICQGDSIFLESQYQQLPGTYHDTLTASFGCDSVVITTLSVYPSFESVESQNICNGSSLQWHNQMLTTAGTYYDSLQTSTGCDSVFYMQLTVSPTYQFNESNTICDGETYQWHGNNYTTAGTYHDSLVSVNGCDSVYILTLNTISYHFYDTATICSGATYSWHNQVLSTAGVYYDSLQTINGCDSIYALTLNHFITPTAAISGGGGICPGTQGIITISLTGASPWTITYFNGGNDTTVTTNLSTYSFYSSLSGTYTASNVSDANCTGITSGTVTVFTYPAPAVFIGNDTTLTNSNSFSLSAGTDFNSYNWSTGDITSDITINTGILSSGVHTYSVSVTDSNGCQASDTIRITINNTAGTDCNNAISVCSQSGTTINTIPDHFSGVTPACFGATPQKDIWLKFEITRNGTLAWKAIPTDLTTEFDWALWDISGGCPGTLVCCNYNYANGSSAGFGMQNISGNAVCGVNSAGNSNAEFCPPMNVVCGKIYAVQVSNYTNTFSGFSFDFLNSTCSVEADPSFTTTNNTGACGFNYLTINPANGGYCNQVWNFGDGTTYTGPTPPAHTYSSSGNYTISNTAQSFCPSTYSQTTNYTAAEPFSIGNDTTICEDATLVLDAGTGYVIYSWNTSENTQAITINANALTPGNEYLYAVSVVDNFSCVLTDTIAVNVDICTFNNPAASEKILVYPNPSTGIVYIEMIEKSDPCELLVFDSRGRIVKKSKFITKSILDLNNLADGIYSLQIKNNTEIVNKRIAISK